VSLDAADGAVEEVARIVVHIRERWPKVRILVCADSDQRDIKDEMARYQRCYLT
jgi:hypothetical protein